MKTNLLFSLLAAGALLVTACKKDADVIDCKPETDESKSIINTFVRAHSAPVQTFTLNPAPSATAIVTTAKGTRISVPAGTFVMPDGTTPVNGPVQLTVREITRKSDMVLSAMPTMSYGQILVSGGQYYLRATQNNVRLRMKRTARIAISVPSPTAPDPDMGLFFGQVDDSSRTFNWMPQQWQPQNPSTIRTDSAAQGVFRYDIRLNNDSLGWVNIDRYMNLNPTTQVKVNIPNTDVSYENTLAFLVFDNFNSVAQIHVPPGGNILSIFYIPVGQRVTAVVIRQVGGQYYFGKQTATVVANQQYTPTLRALTETELVAEIQQL
ncbi:hypothetical protein GCM10027048_15550 [Hymenobacter coalescens]